MITERSINSLNLKLPYGIRKEGDTERLVHISEIRPEESGLKCNCVCPSCGERLQAKLPRTKKDFTPRFAHHSSDSCGYAVETALHMKAKEIIEEAKYIVVPEVIARYNDLFKKEISPSKEITFDYVALERRLNDIVPDILAYVDNQPLMIEITVTHKIDNIKREKIKKLGISTLEIDLSNIDFFNHEQLQYEVLSGINCKRWVYNTEAEKEKEKLRKEYSQVAEKEKERLRKECSQHTKITDITNVKVSGENAFRCDRKVWQTHIFSYVCISIQLCKVQKKKNSFLFTVNDVVESIEKKLYPYVDKDRVFEPVYNYLKVLRDIGYLNESEKPPGIFWVSIPKISRLGLKTSI
jgi:hypothetical protein